LTRIKRLSKDLKLVKTLAEVKIMGEINGPGLAAADELELQTVLVSKIGDASPTTGSGTSNVKEESPRQLHGWKVRKLDLCSIE